MLDSTPRRARSHLSAAVVAILAYTLAACDDGDTLSRTAPDVTDTTAPDVTDTTAPDVTDTTAPDVTDTTAPDVTDTTAPDVTDTTAPDVTDPAAGDEKVVVVFDDLAGAAGRTIVGVLNPLPATVLGGLRLDVDTDPFSARQEVLAPDPDKWTLPPVSDVAALVSPGTYPLYLFVLDRDGNDYGYNPWVPNMPPGISFCSTMVEVRADDGGEVTITGVIPRSEDGLIDDSTECTTSDQ